MKRAKSLPDGSEPDLTPMIDMVFLLLIFFMCTLSFKVLEGRLSTHLPKDLGRSSREWVKSLLPLELDIERDASRAGGVTVRVGLRQRVDVDALPALIAGRLAVQSDLRAKISTQEGVTYGQAMTVLDACVLGGMTDVVFTATSL